MKVVINRCYGGFGLSKEAMDLLGHEYWWDWDDIDMRTDPKLVAIVEKMGSEFCSGQHAKLKVVEIPDDVEWYIDNYDGLETIHEVHRSWC